MTLRYNKNESDFSTFKMENQMETGMKEIVKKEENSDRFSTVANAGNRKKPLEKAKRSIGSMFRRSVKVEISPAEVENTEFGQLAKPVNQEPSQPASSGNAMKKEETSDNWSTMVLPETLLPTSRCQKPSAQNSRKRKILRPGTAQCSKKSKCMDGAPSDMSVSLATTTALDVPGTISTSLLKDANKAKRRATIESSRVQVKRNESTVRNESTRTAPTASAETGAIENSIWESESDDSDEGCSPGAEMNDTEANPNDAADDCDRGQFTCLDCTAVFKTDAAFKQHIASHDGYRRFKCTVCEKRFPSHSHLLVHMRGHTGEKPFKCVCEKKFITNGELTVHKHIHTGKKSYKCDVCKKCFTQSGNLVKHKRIHTGERPFKCDVCKTCFTESGHLKTHKRIHTGEKPYKCLSCGWCFRHNCSLKKHKRRKHSDADAGSELDAPQNSMDQSSTVDACDPLDNSVNGQKIHYKRKSIDRVLEKMASRNPDILYLVWSKKFTMELASAVARSGYNCILCVKKIQPQPFRDVVKLSDGLHTCLVEVGPDSKTLRLFSFGGMVLPEKITDPGRFKSLAKLESKMRRFSQSEGMGMVNIYKHSERNSGWYRSLKEGLKGECIITDKI